MAGVEKPLYLCDYRVERHEVHKSGASYPVSSGSMYPNEAAAEADRARQEAARMKELRAQKLLEFQAQLKERMSRQQRTKKIVQEINTETSAQVPKTPPRVRPGPAAYPPPPASDDSEDEEWDNDEGVGRGMGEAEEDSDEEEGEGVRVTGSLAPMPPRSPAREDGRSWAPVAPVPPGPPARGRVGGAPDISETNLAVRMQHAQAASKFARKSMAFSRRHEGPAGRLTVPVPELGSFGNKSPLKGFHRTCDHSHSGQERPAWKAGLVAEAERWGEGEAAKMHLQREEAVRKLEVRRAEQAAEREATVRRREEAALRSSIELQQKQDLLTWEALHSGTGAPSTVKVHDATDPEVVQRQRHRNQLMERVRIHDAKMQSIADRVRSKGAEIPRLCPCIHTVSPLDSRYPFRCSNNCHLHRNPEEYMHVLTQMLHTMGILD